MTYDSICFIRVIVTIKVMSKNEANQYIFVIQSEVAVLSNTTCYRMLHHLLSPPLYEYLSTLKKTAIVTKARQPLKICNGGCCIELQFMPSDA